MKKTLLFFGLAYAGISFGQTDCGELFFSQYVEGTGNDKALEIYNPTSAAVNLANYTIARASNGSSDPSSGGITVLTGTLNPGEAFVIVNGQTTDQTNSPACSPALQAMADMLDHAYPAPTYLNGNDAMVLYNGTTIVDIIGKIGDGAMATGYGWSDQPPYDGSAGAIWTENHTLNRKPWIKHGVYSNPATFIVTQEWDSLPRDTWTDLGVHTCDCVLGLKEVNNVSFVVYPNPATNGVLNVSAAQPIARVELINLVGEVVYADDKSVAVTSLAVSTSDVNKGIYVIRLVYSDGRTSQASVNIQ